MFYVYTLASHTSVIYIGVTNDPVRRIREHPQKWFPGFGARYNVTGRVYVESGESVISAIEREKQLKGGLCAKKLKRIESMNPSWRDLNSESGLGDSSSSWRPTT